MQTDYLRYFIDVATLGSINAAAKKNFMSPQGISRAITSLETELGCDLLQRESNKVSLTHFGAQVLEEAHAILEHESKMRRSIIEMQAERLRKRSLRFTCYCSPIFFDTPLFFPVSGMGTAPYGKVQFLQRSTPKVVEHLIDSSRIMQPDIVIAGGLGLFSLFADENAQIIEKLTGAGYEYRPFMRTVDYVLVPAFSTLAQEESLSKSVIRSYPLAVAASGGMERAITRHIGSESIYVSSGDSKHRSYLCRTGEALTFVPGVSLVFGAPEGTVAVPMQEPYTIEIGFAARESAFREGVLADTIKRLTAFYSKYRDDGDFELLEGAC